MLKTALTAITLGEAGGLSVLGIAVVFAMLIALMVVVVLLARFSKVKKSKSAEDVNRETIVPTAAVAKPNGETQGANTDNAPAPGSAGIIKLYNVPEKQAAMIMAIVADPLNVPLNQLRFKSIKLID